MLHAGIEYQAHSNRLVIHGKSGDGLLHFVLENHEENFSFSRPETGRFSGSFTVTGTRMSVLLTRMFAAGRFSSLAAGFGRGVSVACPGSHSATAMPSAPIRKRLATRSIVGLAIRKRKRCARCASTPDRLSREPIG